jgi:hypothetical protein
MQINARDFYCPECRAYVDSQEDDAAECINCKRRMHIGCGVMIGSDGFEELLCKGCAVCEVQDCKEPAVTCTDYGNLRCQQHADGPDGCEYVYAEGELGTTAEFAGGEYHDVPSEEHVCGDTAVGMANGKCLCIAHGTQAESDMLW